MPGPHCHLLFLHYFFIVAGGSVRAAQASNKKETNMDTTTSKSLTELMAEYILQAEQLRKELQNAVTQKAQREIISKQEFNNHLLGALARLATGEIRTAAEAHQTPAI